MKIGIFGKTFQEEFHEAIYKIFENLNKHNVEIIIYAPFYDFISQNLYFNPKISKIFRKKEEIDNDVDLFFSIGGDGTFLECVALLQEKNLPIVGINSGRLGFLASISKECIDRALNDIFKGKYTIEERTLLEVSIHNQPVEFIDFPYALNELTVQKKDITSMITIDVSINNQFLNSYWADGLIISTPTGSTAYSLSAGGPIILPGSANFVITPLAPHTLTVRPIVVPEDAELSIKVRGRGEEFLAALDSRTSFLKYETEIKIRKANFAVKILKLNIFEYFHTLRKKLMWGLDIRN